MSNTRIRWGGLLLAACALYGGRAWSEGGTGQLVIVSTPPGATISIDGTRAGHAPLTKSHLLPGDHVVDASWPDGSNASQIAHVNAGASAVLKVAAVAAETGQLVIMTTPAGATISVDGKPQKGVAPMTVRGVTVGSHVLIAQFPDGRTATSTANTTANQSAVVRLEAPALTTGTLMVMSEPAGAQITVDGKRAGTALVALRDIAVGVHQVVAEWPDGRTLTTRTKVVGGVSTAARMVAPPLPVGDLEVTTTPPGAHIEVDGKPQASLSPLTVRQLGVGGHTVVANWADGRTMRATATVIKDGAVGVHLQPPAPLWGHIEVTSEPAGARILVDGLAQNGAAPMTLHQVPTGAHTVVAEWPDGRTATLQATVATSATTRARLTAPPPPHGQLSVLTEPSGAHISVDGKAQPGAAPAMLREVAPGAHEVAADWGDGRTVRQTVKIVAGAAVVARLVAPPPPAPPPPPAAAPPPTAAPPPPPAAPPSAAAPPPAASAPVATGQLVVGSDPMGAKILVDGKPQEQPAPLTVHDLAVGIHEITAQWPDGHTAKRSATVSPGVSALVRLSK